MNSAVATPAVSFPTMNMVTPVAALSARACAVPLGCHGSTPPPEVAAAPRLGPPAYMASQRSAPSLPLRPEGWGSLAASAWVVRRVTKGYRIQFATVPPRFTGILHSQAQGESARVLQEEVTSLLNRGAICVVSPAQSQSGFYSRYFLVPKRGGTGICPILDLRALNSYLRGYKFRMLKHACCVW